MHYLLLLLITFVVEIPSSLAAQSVDEMQRAIQSTTDNMAKAKLLKELGDTLVRQDKYDQAADAYAKALAIGKNSFSTRDRVEMAIHLSWADRLDQSKSELEAVIDAEPKNTAARTHLARVLAWSGELSEAIVQANMVLAQSPDNREAMLVKADALRWQGRYKEARPIYQRLVQTESNFDARMGLSYIELAGGNRLSAQEIAASLKSVNARQERELHKLREAIWQETGPKVDFRYNYYRDSDENTLHRISLTSDFWLGNQKLGLSYRHTEANGEVPLLCCPGFHRTENNRAEDFTLSIYSRVLDFLSAGAGVGFTQLGDGNTSNFPTGHFRLDSRLFAGTIGAAVTREVISDTAELIDNRIRMTNAGIYMSQPLTDRFSVNAGYNYKDFSDGNHANDFQLTSQYTIYHSPRVLVGHRFRLLDFQKQKGNGYFDPNNYIANRAFASVYVEKRNYYAYLETYLGHQTFRRNRVASDDFVYGGAGSIGIKPTAGLAIEVNVEGGNLATGSADGFSYFNVGPRILFRF